MKRKLDTPSEPVEAPPEPVRASATIFPKPNPVIIEFDEMLDRFYVRTNYKWYDPEVYNLLVQMEYRPSDVRAALNNMVALQDELRDPTAKEGYDHLTRTKKSNYIAFLDKIIEDSHIYLRNSRASHKPRKKKTKTNEQLVARVHWQAEERPLRLVSVAPEGIIGATECWLFNTRYHSLTYLTGKLSIKGTTVIGFDPKLSKMKKLRKPELLADTVSGARNYILNFFQTLKTKEYAATGRLNNQTMVLKVFR